MAGDILTGVAAVMASFAAIIVAFNGRNLRQVKKEVKSPNGIPTGESIAEIKATLAEHITNADIHMSQDPC